MKLISIPRPDSLKEAAREFLKSIGNHKILAFNGKMGAGKTTFIKSVCEELGVKDVINSPTFAIVNEYESSLSHELIYHFDFYRIKNIEEAIDIGTQDYFYSGSYCFIEWPDKINTLLPPETLFITIEELPDESRQLTIM